MVRIDLERFGQAEIPEVSQSLIGVTNENETALSLRGNMETLLDIVARFLITMLAECAPEKQAAILGSIFCFIKAYGVLSERVDMAVSLDGHVLPVDEITADAINTIKKDR